MFDKFNRQIDYLRISVTDRCNLRCTYCMPEEGVVPKSHNDILSYEKILEVVKEGIRLGIKKVRLTGGEPLVRKGILFLVQQLKKLPGLGELTLTTNGVLLDNMAHSLKKADLDRINISLDTLDPNKYKEITRIGDIKNVLRGIDAVIKAGFKNTKLNMVLIPGFNDNEVEAMQAFCREKGFALQRINHYSLTNIDSIDRTYVAERPLKCERCNRIRLTADGKLKPCLFSDIEIPLDFSHLRESLINAIQCKPESGTNNVTTQNWQIGG
ncbi:MAG: radical SAM protein [Candidatus Aminicenantes bacterium]|nr:MAG: radical SAM protein [Candidatus Aminicenantes bacterium]